MSFINVGIDLGTSYSYAGVMVGENFMPALHFSHFKRGILTLAKYISSTRRLCFGDAVENSGYCDDSIYYCKKRILDAIANKKPICEDDKKQLRYILQYLLCYAKSVNKKDGVEPLIDTVVVGMPALPSKEAKKYKNIIKACVKTAVAIANSNEDFIVKLSGQSLGERDFELSNEIDVSDERTKVNICIIPEPILALKATIFAYREVEHSGHTLCIDIGGTTVDVAGLRDSKQFSLKCKTSIPLGTIVLDEKVEEIWGRLNKSKIRDIREALTGNTELEVSTKVSDGDKTIPGAKAKNSKSEELELSCNQFFAINDNADITNILSVDSFRENQEGTQSCNTGAREYLFKLNNSEIVKKLNEDNLTLYAFLQQVQEALVDKSNKATENAVTVGRIYLMGGGSKMNVVMPIVKAIFPSAEVIPIDRTSPDEKKHLADEHSFMESKKGVALSVSNAVAFGASLEANNISKRIREKAEKKKKIKQALEQYVAWVMTFILSLGLFLIQLSRHPYISGLGHGVLNNISHCISGATAFICAVVLLSKKSAIETEAERKRAHFAHIGSPIALAIICITIPLFFLIVGI